MADDADLTNDRQQLIHEVNLKRVSDQVAKFLLVSLATVASAVTSLYA